MPALTNKSKLVAGDCSDCGCCNSSSSNGNNVQLLLVLQLHVGGGKLQKGFQPSTVAARRRNTTASSSSDHIVGQDALIKEDGPPVVFYSLTEHTSH